MIASLLLYISTLATPPFVFPEKVDWGNYSGSVRSQGACGACVGFAISAAVETQFLIDCKTPIQRLSPQFIMDCGGGDCKNGMMVVIAAEYAMKHGIPSEKCYPYTTKNGECQPNKCQSVIYPVAIKVTDELDVREIKQALLIGPVIVVIHSFPSMRKHIKGTYSPTPGSVQELNSHAVMMVGYDDNDKTWTFQNFWGSKWGESGYFRVKQSEERLGIRDVWRFRINCGVRQPNVSVSSPT